MVIMTRLLKHISTLTFLAGVLFLLCSCANMAAPTGGLYDEAPPRVVRSNPQNSALNVDRKIVEIEFDENIKIEKPTEKVIITPPQINMPVIKSAGKKAVVEFNDELLPNP